MRRLSAFQSSSRNFMNDQERFFQAVQKGDIKTAESLVTRIDLSALDDKHGYNALHFAAASTATNREEMLSFLLKQEGIEVDTKTRDFEKGIATENVGQTALEIGFNKGDPKTIKLLVEAGADLEKFSEGKNNALTTIAMMTINAYSRSRPAFREASIAILDRMDPEIIIKSLEYLITTKPKAAGFLVGIIRDYSISGTTSHDGETLMKQFIQRFDTLQQARFNEVTSHFKATKILGEKDPAVSDTVPQADSPSGNATKVGCMPFLSSLFRGRS